MSRCPSHPRRLKHRRRVLLALGLALAGLSATTQAQQPAWPKAKPITLLVPYGAGGSLDNTARLLAQGLASRLGQVVNVENATGAGGAIGIGKAIAAAADGYTLLIAGDAPLVPGGPGESSYRFNVLKELVPVVLVNTAPMVVVASPALPVQNFTELVAYTRTRPGQLNYASSGIGTLPHLAMEMVKDRAKIFAVHIPYRGGAQIATDVIGGQVDLAMMVSTSATPHVQAGRMKALAVTGAQRLPTLPGVPTLTELPSFKGLVVESWTGVFAPKGTPAAITDRLNTEINAVLAMDEVRSKLAEGGALTGSGDRAAFARFIAAEQARFEQIVKAANIKE